MNDALLTDLENPAELPQKSFEDVLGEFVNELLDLQLMLDNDESNTDDRASSLAVRLIQHHDLRF